MYRASTFILLRCWLDLLLWCILSCLAAGNTSLAAGGINLEEGSTGLGEDEIGLEWGSIGLGEGGIDPGLVGTGLEWWLARLRMEILAGKELEVEKECISGHLPCWQASTGNQEFVGNLGMFVMIKMLFVKGSCNLTSNMMIGWKWDMEVIGGDRN
ncbi:uncharacterized protein EDB93DRAFT_1109088 [Suillus bovinus]|uniref:uncharacterized protein n=1 Tax=Suillus bovinus TaxID=48563 RepID=UPI001B874793|nr:uncharacterized protein EDB93DRAFT_1109088 [Suillus bovinus]KAG2128055.1 hypothetical protein EDB93DRAFT_1109088 [Suillus bovinus]